MIKISDEVLSELICFQKKYMSVYENRYGQISEADSLITAALEELKKYKDLDKQGLFLRLPCKVGDTVWELCNCNDNVYRVFPMKVANVIAYGSIREIKGKEPVTWNIYAISDYTDMYKSFYDIGKTVFLTKEEAEEALRKTKESEAGK